MPSPNKSLRPGVSAPVIGGPVTGGAPAGSTLTRDTGLTFSTDPRINRAFQEAARIFGSDPNFALAQAGQEEAIGTAAPIGDEIRAFGEEFASSPRLAALFQGFEERASPDFSVVSDPQRSAIELQLSQGLNRARQSRAAALRSRGLFGSGLDVGNDPMFAALGSVGLGQISAGIAEADAAARERALSSLGSLTTEVGRFQGDILSRAGSADQFTAALQKDVPQSSFDPFAVASLAEGFRVNQIDLDLFERQLAEVEKQGELGPLDLLNFVANFFGGGLGG